MNQWHAFTADTIGDAERMRDGGATWVEIGERFGTTNAGARLAFIRFGLRVEPWPQCYLYDSNGYVMASLPDGRKEFVHRLVAEEHLSRPLSAGEVVHHLDEDKRNNAWSNLAVLSSHAAHAIEHHPGARGLLCHSCDAPALYIRREGSPLCRRCYNHQRRYHEQGNRCASARPCPFAA